MRRRPDPYPCKGAIYTSLYKAAVALEQEIAERGGMYYVARQPRTYRCAEGHFHNEIRWRRTHETAPPSRS